MQTLDSLERLHRSATSLREFGRPRRGLDDSDVRMLGGTSMDRTIKARDLTRTVAETGALS